MGLLYGVLLYTLAQALIWFQTNGQFIWPWFKKNPLILSIFGGTVISYIFIKATTFTVGYFEGSLWPGRFIGFSTGILIFAILTWFFMNEGINMKTAISLILATALMCVQIFWK